MRDRELIHIERGIEAMQSELHLMRCKLEIEKRQLDGEVLSPAWTAARAILTERRDLTQAIAKACGDTEL